jgi:hypothetical protein
LGGKSKACKKGLFEERPEYNLLLGKIQGSIGKM